MDKELIKHLQKLADKYEISSFTDGDPSFVLKRYKSTPETETAAFIAAMLAFGNRHQFIPKIELILETAEKQGLTAYSWIKNARFKDDFPHGSSKFYRFYSYDDMHCLFEELCDVFERYKTLGNAVKSLMKQDENLSAPSDILCSLFPRSRIVPKGKNSACKRVHMFLRWMVRRNSPVDLGLWDWIDPADLIIPLDVHVLEEAKKLGLLPETTRPDKKAAVELTKTLDQIFPGDPCRGDFALFGLGVDI
ncbi:MAG: TIGR02757 family protein [Treponema sp.]|nr:TIGR02757 family protein [Treponema sp.]